MHRIPSIFCIVGAMALVAGGCSPSLPPGPPPAVTVTESVPAQPTVTASHSAAPQPKAAPKTAGCAKQRFELKEVTQVCACDKVGAPLDSVCGKDVAGAEAGDIVVEVRVSPDPAANGETVTAEVIIANRGAKPGLIEFDILNLYMQRRFSVHDSQSVRVDRPDDDTNCQNNYVRDLIVLPPGPINRFVLLPGAEAVDRLTWKAERATWGAPKNHTSAVGIPTCEVVGSSVPLKPGRYTFTILTGVKSPAGLSEARGDFAIDK